MSDKTYKHPLVELYPASEETNGEATMNSWVFASMIANVATGRANEGDERTAIGMAKELILLADPSVNADVLILQAAIGDAEMAKLINLCNQGLEAKLDAAFGK